MTRHDTTRHDTTRHDTTRHDTTRHCPLFKYFSIITILCVTALLAVGCAKDDDDDGRVDYSNSSITNGPNEAWVNCGMFTAITGISDVECSGSSFPANGDKIGVYKINGVWYGCVEGTWAPNGANGLTMTLVNGVKAAGTYTISNSGNTLTMDGYAFEKTAVTWTPKTLAEIQRMLGLGKRPLPNMGTWSTE